MQDERNRQAKARKKAEHEAQNNRPRGEWRNFGDPNRKTKRELLEEKRKAQSVPVKISEGVTTTTTKGCFPILLMIPAGILALGYLSIQHLQNLK